MARHPLPAAEPLAPEDFGIPSEPTDGWETLPPKLLAKHLGVSPSTIVRMIEDGELRALRVRGCYVIPHCEVLAFFRRQAAALN